MVATLAHRSVSDIDDGGRKGEGGGRKGSVRRC